MLINDFIDYSKLMNFNVFISPDLIELLIVSKNYKLMNILVSRNILFKQIETKSKEVGDILNAIDSTSNELLKFEKYIKVSDFIIHILTNTPFRQRLEILGKTQVYIYKFKDITKFKVGNVIENELFLILLNLQRVTDFRECTNWLVKKRNH